MSGVTREFAEYAAKEIIRVAERDMLATGAGSAKDWANYKERVGRQKGLIDASLMMEPLLKRFIGSEDDDED